MNQPLAPIDIPDKSSFKPSEVCDLLAIPSYVLRTWENEFKDLGVIRTPGAARAYRRQDVELAARIKSLVFTEHLTLAGVRRRLEQEHLLAAPPEEPAGPVAASATPAPLAAPVRERLGHVKRELRSLLDSLGEDRQRAATGGASPPVPADAARVRSRADRVRREDDGLIPALPGLGEAGDAADAAPDEVHLDPSALNFASVTAQPAAPAGRRRRQD